MPVVAETARDCAAAIDAVLALVRDELVSATSKFDPFASAHEGYAVTLEELDELWHEVKANRPDRAAEEAVQVAAMGARFVLDLGLPYLLTAEQHVAAGLSALPEEDRRHVR